MSTIGSVAFIAAVINNKAEKDIRPKDIEKMLREGLYHVTEGTSVEKIVESSHVRASGVVSSYSTVFGWMKKGIDKLITKGVKGSNLLGDFIKDEGSGLDLVAGEKAMVKGVKTAVSLAGEMKSVKRSFFFNGKPDIYQYSSNIDVSKLKDTTLHAAWMSPDEVKRIIDEEGVKNFSTRADGVIMYKGNLEGKFVPRDLLIDLNEQGNLEIIDKTEEVDLNNKETVLNKLTTSKVVKASAEKTFKDIKENNKRQGVVKSTFKELNMKTKNDVLERNAELNPGSTQLSLSEVLEVLMLDESYEDYFKAMTSEEYQNLFSVGALNGFNHSVRSTLIATAIASQEGLDEKDIKVVMEAMKYHAIGSKFGAFEKNHGKRSVEKVIDNELLEFDDEADKEMVEFLINNHEDKKKKIEKKLSFYKTEEKNRALELMSIVKDAHSLDRVRLGDLDPSYLITDSSKNLINFAYAAYEHEDELVSDLDFERLKVLFDISDEYFPDKADVLKLSEAEVPTMDMETEEIVEVDGIS